MEFRCLRRDLGNVLVASLIVESLTVTEENSDYEESSATIVNEFQFNSSIIIGHRWQAFFLLHISALWKKGVYYACFQETHNLITLMRYLQNVFDSINQVWTWMQANFGYQIFWPSQYHQCVGQKISISHKFLFLGRIPHLLPFFTPTFRFLH